ncbi:competence protein FA [Enterococcus canis]|uniref:Competence protein FA n=1 Tax=Enterococcus canis TaxID=214095 RepID=A0A1L8RJW2_9ENTE|nr:helicase-related protein [Enterococcus canis]OJG20059.1 competence protein FA [Enterococcus canis]
MEQQNYFGRLVFLSESLPNIAGQPALSVRGKWVVCQRCGEKTLKKQVLLATGHYYCPHCLIMGRVSSAGWLYWLPQPLFKLNQWQLTWQGELTVKQQQVADQLLDWHDKRQNGLVWAVTGAGKTEMMFPVILAALNRGERVAVASPRVDVCLELQPRLEQAFNGKVILLYGGEDYQYGQLTLCTTHQLLRFKEAFQLLIIDEVDAFPYVSEKMLQYAAQRACQPQGTLLYLTATPTTALKRQIAKKELSVMILPRRFHGQPLVVPEFLWCVGWRQLSASALKKIIKLINTWRRQGEPLLLFCPEIRYMAKLKTALQAFFPEITAVHAADPQRQEKVAAFRQGTNHLLLSSTILERGVTFPGVNVLVIGANDRVFSKSALVQIAGRVGRSLAKPDGFVGFLHDGLSLAMKNARQEIRFLNRLD